MIKIVGLLIVTTSVCGVYADRLEQSQEILERLNQPDVKLWVEEQSPDGKTRITDDRGKVTFRYQDSQHPFLVTWDDSRAPLPFSGKTAFTTESDALVKAKHILDAVAPGNDFSLQDATFKDKGSVEVSRTSRVRITVHFLTTVNGYPAYHSGNVANVSLDSETGSPISVMYRDGYTYLTPMLTLTEEQALQKLFNKYHVEPKLKSSELRYCSASMFEGLESGGYKTCVLAYMFSFVDGTMIAVTAHEGKLSELMDRQGSGAAPGWKVRSPLHQTLLTAGVSIAAAALIIATFLKVRHKSSLT